MTFVDQHVGQHGSRFVDPALNVAVAQRDRPLQFDHGRRTAFRERGKHSRFRPGRGVLRKAPDEIGRIGRRPVELTGHPEQFRLDRHQAGPVVTLLLDLIDMLETGDELLAFDHAIDLLQFGQEVWATELDLLAGSARTKGISVEGHGGESR